MKSRTNLAPVMEGLEPRLLLSGLGLEPGLQLASAPPSEPSSVLAATLSSPVRGREVTAWIRSYEGTMRMVVLGTMAADAITLTQNATSVTLTTPQGSITYNGAFTQVRVYGFGGNDTIRIASSVTADVTVYAGDDNNTVYDLGRGHDTVYAGAGNDTLISFGGGSAHTVYGGDGLDTFWVDGATTVDATPAENAAGTVHTVVQFYGGVSMDISGQALADPAFTRYATRYDSFASSPLFTDGPTYSDIRQGAVGDCYYLSSLASLADTNPDSIRQMITPLGDGTYAVRFYRSGSPVYLRLDADLPVNSGGAVVYARLSASGEIWVPLLEKAYAAFRTGANSYSSLEAGWMGNVYLDAVNRSSTTLYTDTSDQQIYALITSSLSTGRAVTAASYSSASGPIVGNHAYEVKAAYASDGTMYVTVYNPWGYDGTNSDSNPGDGLITLTMAQFKQYFQVLSAIV